MQPKNGKRQLWQVGTYVIYLRMAGVKTLLTNKPDLIEDVAELRVNFHRYDVKCQLCMRFEEQ
jgi:hypothetical protein